MLNQLNLLTFVQILMKNTLLSISYRDIRNMRSKKMNSLVLSVIVW